MSIAMERTDSGGDRPTERPVFIFSIYDDDRRSEEDYRPSSSSTSSIGKNSDDCSSTDGKSNCEEEVESEYKVGPLDSLEDLEEVLPVKKSISNMYNGKSKSFTSLADAVSCSSINEIANPENPYGKKRKNLLAFNNLWDKTNKNFLNSRNGGLSKRPLNSRSMVTIAASTNSSDSNSVKTSHSYKSPSISSLPPLPPLARRTMHGGLPSYPPPDDEISSWRSFSLWDLQGAAEAAISSNNGYGRNDIVNAVNQLKEGFQRIKLEMIYCSLDCIRKGKEGVVTEDIYLIMDGTTGITLTKDEFKIFHGIDRSLYLLLVKSLFRNPLECLYVMALWMWLERPPRNFNGFINKILSLPQSLIYSLAEEALACLKCLNPDFPFSSELHEIPMTSSLLDIDMNLLYFYEQRMTGFDEVKDLVNRVLLPTVSDIMGKYASGGPARYHSPAPARAPARTLPTSYLRHRSSVNSFPYTSARRSEPYLQGPGRAYDAARTARTMFVTFSKGYPVTKAEVTHFFTRIFGNCIESFHMQEVEPNEQSLYARIVFLNEGFIHSILDGQQTAKFTINRKHVWMRRFVPRITRSAVCRCASVDGGCNCGR